ncbi:MAG: holo-ACP synthase [Acidobacteriaceae bacterium]|nr:holo-ACP synthase [Acidobacteriaceae bacterium]
MVLGLGSDLIEIGRIAESMKRYGDRFLARVFTAGEIAFCQRKRHHAAESFAARFAAKEAAAKALGTGISRGISWREIEVRRELGHRPEIVLHGRAKEWAARMGVQKMHLTLTHSRDLAMAVVLAED